MSGTPLVEFEGKVELRQLKAGSKSEHLGPVLVDASGGARPLHLKGENPFEEPTLRGLAGMRVSVRGRLRAGVLIVAPEDLERQPAKESSE